MNERATGWEADKLIRLNIYEGSVPFENYYGTYSLSADGDGTLVAFGMEYEIPSDTTLDPERVEQRNRDRFIPEVLNGLKHFIENCGQAPTSS